METPQGTYAMGGEGEDEDEVLKLDCPGDQVQSCEWKEMKQKLEEPRRLHVTIPIPESFAICN